MKSKNKYSFFYFFSKIFGHIKKKQYLCSRFWGNRCFSTFETIKTLKTGAQRKWWL